MSWMINSVRFAALYCWCLFTDILNEERFRARNSAVIARMFFVLMCFECVLLLLLLVGVFIFGWCFIFVLLLFSRYIYDNRKHNF